MGWSPKLKKARIYTDSTGAKMALKHIQREEPEAGACVDKVVITHGF